MGSSLKKIFTDFIEKPSLFRGKNALSPTYLPETLLHRTKEIEQLGTILAPLLKDETPSNVLVFGWTGVGKTVAVKNVCRELEEMATEVKKDIVIVYLNCKMEKINTEYRLLAKLAEGLGEKVAFTGLPTDVIYATVFKKINEKKKAVLVVLDEIDAMDQASDVLYDLTRINYELTNGSKVCVIGISNDLNFIDSITPKVRSSFSGEDLVFPPYDASQLQDILTQRSEEAFLPDVLGVGVISKCSALAAQEHGDARRALNLLRVAAEIADRRSLEKVTDEHVELAEERIDMESITEVTRTLPRQSQVVFWSILEMSNGGGESLATGDVYNKYLGICKELKLSPLTQRRVSDLISELDTLGTINARTVSKGRYGRTKDISLNLNNKTTLKVSQILKEELMLP